MSFNQYSAYTIVSVSSGQSTEDVKKVFEITDELENIKNAEEAKNFIKYKFNIFEPVQDYPIGNNAFLTITEDDELYSINLVYTNENLTYMFEK